MSLNPSPADRMDYWMGVLICNIINIVNAFGTKKDERIKTVNPGDVVPVWGETQDEYDNRVLAKTQRQSMEDLKRDLLAWAHAHNRQLEKKEGRL